MASCGCVAAARLSVSRVLCCRHVCSGCALQQWRRLLHVYDPAGVEPKDPGLDFAALCLSHGAGGAAGPAATAAVESTHPAESTDANDQLAALLEDDLL
jgi:hypothetical protein